MPTVRQIVKKYLEAHGYEGLFYDGECGCSLEDLMPCDGPCEECEPGYMAPCACGDHDWHIEPKRPENAEVEP